MSKNVKRVILDKKKCIGCATCTVLCPEVFSFNEKEAIAVINNKAVTTASTDTVRSAVQACPSNALIIED